MEQFAGRVRLATSSPIIRSFFEELQRASPGTLVLEPVGLDPSIAERSSVGLATVTVAVVDTDATAELPAGKAACQALRARRPDLPVVALVYTSGAITPWHVLSLVAGDLAGLVDRRVTADELLGLLTHVANGRVVVCVQHDLAHWTRLWGTVTGRQQVQDVTRSFGEQDDHLLELATKGLTEEAIGQQLYLAPSTVHHHLERLRRAARARNRIELAAWAAVHGYYRPTHATADSAQASLRDG